MPRANEEIEALLSEWAELLQIAGADAFRVRAYEKAARAIGSHAADVRTLTDKEILGIPAVGAHMAARVREYLDTGTMRELEDVRRVVPGAVRELMRIPGLGPRKAILLHDQLGVGSVEDLRRAIAERRVRNVRGLGVKTEQNIARAIETMRSLTDRMLLDVALETAETVIGALASSVAIPRIAYAGSLRRMCETIGDIDLLVASSDPGPIMDVFATMAGVRQVLAKGETKSSVVTRRGVQVDLRIVPEEAWGAALIYFTGSKSHNIALREMAIKKGLKLSEWGLFQSPTGRQIAARSEEDVYDALGLPWIPPVLREDAGEIDAALKGSLPALVAEGDLHGDLHSHTDLTDGRASLDEMLAAAAARGYRYFAVTDHAEDLSMTGASREKMRAQRRRIAAAQKHFPSMTLLHGAELNIGRDGGVDYDPAFLASFDVLVASVHSLFRLSREEATRRLIAVTQNPYVDIIGHPSGRLIGKRDPVDFDVEAVCEAAARTGTALEVNCFPDRLDLRSEHVRHAIERGVVVSINTDAHAPKDLLNRRFGVATAQRGWACKGDVLNARALRNVRAFVARKRARA